MCCLHLGKTRTKPLSILIGYLWTPGRDRRCMTVKHTHRGIYVPACTVARWRVWPCHWPRQGCYMLIVKEADREESIPCLADTCLRWVVQLLPHHSRNGVDAPPHQMQLVSHHSREAAGVPLRDYVLRTEFLYLFSLEAVVSWCMVLPYNILVLTAFSPAP